MSFESIFPNSISELLSEFDNAESIDVTVLLASLLLSNGSSWGDNCFSGTSGCSDGIFPLLTSSIALRNCNGI